VIRTRRASRPPVRGRARLALVLGRLLVVVSVILGLIVGYEFFWTDFTANRAAKDATQTVQRVWDEGGLTPADRPTNGAAVQPISTDVFGIMRIPRLGGDWQKPIIEGVTMDDLARGVGHYPDTAMPGVIGNFAVAGHRVTHGGPFRDLDRLRKGDPISVQIRDTVYVYRVRGIKIVTPDRTDVLFPVPRQFGVDPVEPLLTLTTCHPKYSARERLIVVAEFDTAYPVALAPAKFKAAKSD
jgi:sortase A